MTIKQNFTDSLRKLSEGNLDPGKHVDVPIPSPTFVRMVVMDVISDPNNDINDVKRKTSWHGMGITNTKYADVLPRNTIIAKRVGEDGSPMFVFPFFPSHLALPCKPGECVWVMFERPEASYSDIAFWFCRVVEPHMTDDVNHAHPGSSFETSMFPGSKDRFQDEKKGTAATGENVWSELRNSPVVKYGEDRTSSGNGILLRGEVEDIFERLITETHSSKMMTYEAIPRFRKRPGDLALEGTNNTLIVLGTDRSGPAANYKDPETDEDKILYEKTPEIPNTDRRMGAGSIDIVAGRGRTEKTFGKEVATTSINNANGESKGREIKKELNKSLDQLSRSEGDPDLKNDRSRILVSQKTNVDKNLGLDKYNEEKVDIKGSSDGDAAIIIKSDKIRLVSRSDLQILVTGFTESNSPDKQKSKVEETNTDKWASITIKTNGDIVFTPAKVGIVKLGGEDADKAVLCFNAAGTTNANGTVVAPPTMSTMGGFLGTGGAHGVYASKIMVK